VGMGDEDGLHRYSLRLGLRVISGVHIHSFGFYDFLRYHDPWLAIYP